MNKGNQTNNPYSDASWRAKRKKQQPLRLTSPVVYKQAREGLSSQGFSMDLFHITEKRDSLKAMKCKSPKQWRELAELNRVISLAQNLIRGGEA